MRICSALWWVLVFAFGGRAQAQSYTPVTITGYNHDIFTETFPDAVATTDTVLDATFHIMYTEGFAAASGLPAGVPNSGFISDGGIHQYQLAPYNGLNALTIMRNTNRTFSLVTPSAFTKLSLLCFSTELASTINVSVRFTDGSITNYVTSYVLADWFNSTTNVVLSGFSRCRRVTAAPYSQDGLPGNPRFYYLDINLNCADQQKNVQNIIIANVTTTGANAPFPNAVFLALSGQAYVQTITSTTTQATCSSPNGSASLTITGNTSPYNISWNTNPVQNGTSISNVAAGTYTATITDANSCVTSFNVTVPSQPSTVTATAAATPTAICNGGSAQLSVSATGGTLNSFTWTPGNLSGASVTVNPTTTTQYTVSGQDQYGCSYSKNVTVTVNNPPAAPAATGVQICQGQQASLAVQNPVTGEVYNWYAAATGGSSLATGNNFQSPVLSSTTTYYLEATGSNSCVNTTRTPVTVTINALPASPTINAVSICPGATALLGVQNPQTGWVYNWYSAATGGSSFFSGNSYTTPALSSATIYYVEAVSSQSCPSGSRGTAAVSILQALPKPVVTVSNITASSLSFSWNAVPNATGYQVTIDGVNFTSPSSGATGTTHTVTGLIPGQSITIRVRALGPQSCQNSALSDAVTAFVPDKNLFVPNVFTPNGDGKNDVLLVFSNSLAAIDLRIFNQWGQEIFASTTPSKGWDGSFKGQQQPIGVYVYVLKATLTDGTVISKKGSVSLVR